MKLFESLIPNMVRRELGDKFVLCLTATEPKGSKLADLTLVDAKNLSSRELSVKFTENKGVISLDVEPITLTANGTVGPFKYLVIANGQTLVGWQERKETSLDTNDKLTVTFTNPVLTIGI